MASDSESVVRLYSRAERRNSIEGHHDPELAEGVVIFKIDGSIFVVGGRSGLTLLHAMNKLG